MGAKPPYPLTFNGNRGAVLMHRSFFVREKAMGERAKVKGYF